MVALGNNQIKSKGLNLSDTRRKFTYVSKLCKFELIFSNPIHLCKLIRQIFNVLEAQTSVLGSDFEVYA